MTTVPPLTPRERFLALSANAHTSLSGVRAMMLPIDGKPPVIAPVQAHRELGHAFNAVGKLHDAYGIAPDPRAGSWMLRAANNAKEGISELERAAAGRSFDTDFVFTRVESALRDITTGRGMVTHPPTDVVYDGS